MKYLGLDHVSAVPQVFMKKNKNDYLILLAIKVVDDIVFIDIPAVLDELIEHFEAQFRPDTTCKKTWAYVHF